MKQLLRQILWMYALTGCNTANAIRCNKRKLARSAAKTLPRCVVERLCENPTFVEWMDVRH